MPVPLDWTTDPIVVLEKMIEPVLSAAPEALCAIALCQIAPGGKGQLGAHLAAIETLFPAALDSLNSGGAACLEETGVRLSDDDLQLCRKAAATLAELGERLIAMLKAESATSSDMADCAALIGARARPEVSAALDAMRATFIGHILNKHHEVAARSEAAIEQLSVVSKKIFYISLNASVEAARVGDAGRGFSFISQEIRTLSQDAQAATANLARAFGPAN